MKRREKSGLELTNNSKRTRTRDAADKSSEPPSPLPTDKKAGTAGNDPTAAHPTLLVDNKKKWRSWRERFWTTWAMLGGFVVLVFLGHFVLLAFVLVLQCVMYYEVVRIGHEHAHENHLPGFRHLQWYWFFVAMVASYLPLLHFIHDWAIVDTISQHALFISFSLYTVGVVGFVISLKKGHYKYQFGMFSWCHVVLLVVVVQAHFLVQNMFEGLIWFIMPALLIVNNDVFAYFFGFFWGRTKLIELSPKKTWEGFMGGMLMTLVVAFWLARVLAQWEFMICPKLGLSLSQPTCERVFPFNYEPHRLPQPLLDVLTTLHIPHWEYVNIMPVQWHSISMAMFASIIAPFGGFFASGFKRAFKIKDFGDSIPGHGGVTDRMDCQVLMGVFAYVYYNTFIKATQVGVEAVMTSFARLSTDEQLQVYHSIKAALQQ